MLCVLCALGATGARSLVKQCCYLPVRGSVVTARPDWFPGAVLSLCLSLLVLYRSITAQSFILFQHPLIISHHPNLVATGSCWGSSFYKFVWLAGQMTLGWPRARGGRGGGSLWYLTGPAGDGTRSMQTQRKKKINKWTIADVVRSSNSLINQPWRSSRPSAQWHLWHFQSFRRRPSSVGAPCCVLGSSGTGGASPCVHLLQTGAGAGCSVRGLWCWMQLASEPALVWKTQQERPLIAPLCRRALSFPLSASAAHGVAASVFSLPLLSFFMLFFYSVIFWPN